MATKPSSVPMPAGQSNRIDLNPANRVAKINREAQIQNAPGAGYNVNNQLTQLTQGASTDVNTPVFPAPSTSSYVNNMPPSVDMFAPGDQGRPITDGVDGGTAGLGSDSLNPSLAAPDQLGILARALYSANPTPQNRRLLEAFIEEGR